VRESAYDMSGLNSSKMKYLVHRVRFVDYVPQAIHCLALEDCEDPSRLALSRADGSIEIWNIKDDWYQETVIRGCNGTSVESLDWCKGRLFTAGLHAEITEWDLTSLCPKVTVDSFGGAVWCLSVDHARTHLAAGCEDGTVRLFEVTSDGISYSKSLDQQQGRVLCLSWHVNDITLVTGSADSTVRVYNVVTGHCNLRITVDEFQSRSTLIWAIHITRDFVIITGDSLGNTQFWDGSHGTLLQSFKAHLADVLAVCANKDENMVFSGGVDSKIVQFQQITNKDGVPNWVRAASERMYSQDVRCLATLSGNHNFVISGGIDPNIVLYSIKQFGRSRCGGSSYRKIPPFPHVSMLCLASAANVLMYQMQSGLQFWKLEQTDDKSTTLKRAPVHLMEIKKKGDNHIVCSAISPCARWAAFSDVYHVSLFKLNLVTDGQSQVTVTKVFPLPVELLPAKQIIFTCDSSKLICTTSQGLIQILVVGDEPQLSNNLKIPHQTKDPPAIHLAAVSDDFHWLACSDFAKTVNIFSLRKMKLKSTLPQLESRITAMAFQPKTNKLAVICCNHQIFLFKPSSGKLTDWSKQALEHGLPKQWIGHHYKVINVQFDPSNHGLMLLQDDQMFTLLDLTEPLPDVDVVLYESKLVQERKRKNPSCVDGAQTDRQQKAFKVCRKYYPLLYAGYTKDGSLVVVERPWKSIVEKLPPPLYRKKYGT